MSLKGLSKRQLAKAFKSMPKPRKSEPGEFGYSRHCLNLEHSAICDGKSPSCSEAPSGPEEGVGR